MHVLTLEDRAMAVARAGFGPLPLPAQMKWQPPVGSIGADDPLPAFADWLNWTTGQYTNYTNLGMRMPEGVFCIDVDSHKEAGLAKWLELGGPEWEPTFRISARGFNDGRGHWIYRVPPMRDAHELPGAWGGIETLRSWHRYSMAPGSWNPDAGGEYVLIDMRDGQVHETMVPVDQIPTMSVRMWEALITTTAHVRVEGSDTPLTSDGDGACGAVAAIRIPDWSEGSRYDTVNSLIWRLVRLHHEGHRGVPDALISLKMAYITEMDANPRRGGAPPEIEFERSVRQAEEKQHGFTDECRCDLAAWEPPVEQDPFWEARPFLTEIRSYAASKIAPPWSVLGAWLANVASEIPPWVVLPSIAGPHASLNLYVALVGKPSGGKSVSQGLARDEMGQMFSHLPTGWTSREGGLGSGEGLAKMFGSIKAEKDPMSGIKVERMEWLTPNRVVFKTDEIGTLEAVANRVGATLSPLVRSAWLGAGIQVSYAATDKRIDLPSHTYRMSIVVGAQPEAVDWLLKEHKVGTPQRYLWMRADGDADPDAPDHLITPMLFMPDAIKDMDHADRLVIVFPDDITYMIKCRRASQVNGDEGAPQQHSDMQRMKLAAILGVIDGRLEVTWDDWNLACRIVGHSERQIQGLINLHRDLQQSEAIGRGKTQAVTEEAKMDEVVTQKAKALVHRIMAHDELEHHCNSKCYKAAISRPAGGIQVGALRRAARERALEMGWLEEYDYLTESAVPAPAVGIRVGPRWPR